jgi:hypothetical protein
MLQMMTNMVSSFQLLISFIKQACDFSKFEFKYHLCQNICISYSIEFVCDDAKGIIATSESWC